MKRLFLVMTMFQLLFLAEAQVNINWHMPGAGFVNRSQLWALSLMNANTEPQRVTLRISIQDANSNEMLLTASGSMIECPKGVKNCSERDFMPIVYNFSHPTFNRNTLPIGSYIVCFRVFADESKGGIVLGEECVLFNVEPLSPPQLTNPENEAKIPIGNPLLTWLPPMPPDMFSDLNYTLNICEIAEDQRPEEAILSNIPVYSRSGIKTSYMQYDASAFKLSPGKSYAWQVIALNDFQYSAKSEVWQFSVLKDSIRSLIQSIPYVKMDAEMREPSIAHEGYVRVYFVNHSSDTTAEFIVKAPPEGKTNRGAAIERFTRKIIQGENFIELTLAKRRKYKKDSVYEVHYRPKSGQSIFIRFKPVFY